MTSAGSAVEETIFPGSDHEMVTLYHLDGDDLILTHYDEAVELMQNSPFLDDCRIELHQTDPMGCGGD